MSEVPLERMPFVRRLAAQRDINRILAESTSVEQAMPDILRAVCTCLDWQTGALWRLRPGEDSLRCEATWIETPAFEAFERLTRSRRFVAGIGLPGRVWETGRVAWITDVVRDSNFPRAAVAARVGLHGAFGFPIWVGGDFFGLMEFFSRDERASDDVLLTMMETVGSQIGHFVRRIEAEQALRESYLAADAERARLRELFNLAPAFVAVFEGPEQRIGFMNAHTLEALNAGPRIIGRRAPDVFPELAAQGYFDLLSRVYRSGEPYIGKEAPATSPRWHGERYFNFLLMPLRTPDGEVTGVFFHAVDVTDQVRTIRARENFLSIASHELRNPLNAIQLHASGMQRVARTRPASCSPEWVVEQVDRVTEMVGRLGRLIDYLLDVSRITAGRLDLDLDDVELSALVRSVIDREKESLAGQEISLRADPGVVGRWDRMRLEQVVANLLSNAFKYGGGRPIDVTVAPGEEWARIRITDRGAGISPADRLRIFQRFERSESERRPGFGLGLWIAKQIVEAHGGRIDVESEPGRGSTFLVDLPVKQRQIGSAGKS